MRRCHRLIKRRLYSVYGSKGCVALEVAAGDGILSQDLLSDWFAEIDCFDQCSDAVKKLEELRERVP